METLEQASRTSVTGSDHNDLLTLLFLTKRLSALTLVSELEFFLVNETLQLHPYTQAALWCKNRGVVAVSGVSQVNQQTPYADWLNQLAKNLPITGKFRAVTTDLSLIASEQDTEWRSFVPANMLFVELPAKGDFEGGFLLLWAEGRFRTLFSQLLENLADSWVTRYAELWKVTPKQLVRSKWYALKENKKKRNLALGLTLLFLLFPIRLTVLAPAELIALDPAIIRAPMDGIIGRVYVRPNQQVAKDDKLFDFDESNLSSQLAIANSELETAKATYRQAAQQALFDEAVKPKLPILREKVAEKSAKLAWLEKLNDRSGIQAPKAGVVLLNSPDEWNGRAVATGERVLTIAQPESVQIEAWISPGDLIEFSDDAPVKLYLDAFPLSPLAGRMQSLSLMPETRPDGHMAYRARFALDSDQSARARLGYKGTARLSGGYVPLTYWLIRKPLASIRGYLGL